MNIKELYVKTCTKLIRKMDPSLEKEDVERCINSILKRNFKDPTIIMDNNVTGENHTITLSKLCGYIENENPVISGNATFFCQPEVLQSPTSNFLRTSKKNRKKIKNFMFSLKAGSDEYAAKDLAQQNLKVIMNADYGGSGTPTAAFYTKYSPAATTLMAQSIITTMAAFFEGFVGDNLKFFSTNECFDWMEKVCKKDDKVHEWLHVPSKKQVADRIKHYFIYPDISDFETIDMYVDSCNETQLAYLYYANNYKDLIRNHKNIQDVIGRLMWALPCYEASEDEVPDGFKDRFKESNDYNKWMSNEMFLNPYTIPDCIKKEMKELTELFSQYVYVEYITPDSIVKLNNHKRNTVLLVDTDSNMLNIDLFVQFILQEIFPDETFGRKKMYNEMILVNVMCAAMDASVKAILDYYGRCHHMNEESRSELTMKNEFLFKTFFLMNVKKRYAASIVLREGNIMIPFKTELKGVDFIKAAVTKSVSKRFEKILCDNIIFSEDVNLHGLMSDLKSYEKEMYNDIHSGGTSFYKQTQYKSEEGYSNAWSLPVFKGSTLWNELVPDKKIYPLDRVIMIKLNVKGLTDIECIKHKYPEMYNMIAQKVFLNPSESIKKCGMKVICIPNSFKKVPNWLIPLIDDQIIISDMISSFKSVLTALNIEEIQINTPNGNAGMVSALISL